MWQLLTPPPRTHILVSSGCRHVAWCFFVEPFPTLKEFLVKKVNLAIAAVTASTLFGSIAVMAPQASAAQPTREVVPAASSTLPKPNLSPDCIQTLKDEGKLSTEIKKQLLIAGLSAKDAACLLYTSDAADDLTTV